MGKNRVSGTFKDIDLNGAIRIKLASGQIHTIAAGEFFFDPIHCEKAGEIEG